jgi:neutral ceramidase
VWELIGAPSNVYSELSERVAKELGIPVQNFLLAAVHDHSAPSLGRTSGTDSKTGAYTAFVENAAFEAIRKAKANLQPARVGAGTGRAYINMNRRECPPGRPCSLGQNPDFPSDKTVAVVKFETMAGKPIALFINYGVHDVVMGPENYQITGDLAGATSRFVEQFYQGALTPTNRGDLGAGLRLRPEDKVEGDGIVALWTSGAAGDQNPISVARGSDFTLVDAFGKILGEEAIRVASTIRTSPNVTLRGVQREVSCPGRSRAAQGQAAGAEPKSTDAEPVSIHLGLLMIGDIAVTGVSGEVLTMIGQRLKKESPFNFTMMVTHADGSVGYIPNDAAYEQPSYEVNSTRFKPGCAEGAIVNGLLDMMDQR